MQLKSGDDDATCSIRDDDAIFIDPANCEDFGMEDDDNVDSLCFNEEVQDDCDALETRETSQENSCGNFSLTFSINAAAICLSVNPKQHDLVAVGCQDDTARLLILNKNHATQIAILEGHRDTVVGVSFSPDGTLLATCAYDGTVRVWNAVHGFEVAHVFETSGLEVEWVTWHPEKKNLCAGCSDLTVWMWNAPVTGRGQLLLVINCAVLGGRTAAGSFCGKFSRDGQTFITAGGSENVVASWNLVSGSCLYSRRSRQGFNSHRKKKGDLELNLENSNYSEFRQEYESSGITSLTDTQASVIVIGAMDGNVSVIHLKNERLVAELKGHFGSVEAVELSWDNRFLATASLDGILQIWDTTKLFAKSLIPRHKLQLAAGVTQVCWHKNSTVILCAMLNGEIALINALTGEYIATCGGHKEQVLDVKCASVTNSPECFRVISASDDQTIKAFDFCITE